MPDTETVSVYDKEIDTYAKLVENEKPDEAMRHFISHLHKGARVLDLGCGPGHHSEIMVQHGLNVDAIDASEEMVKLAKDKRRINARVATFDELSENNQYDGIWASFSLLHARRSEFRKHLNSIHTALKSNGLFHIGMKLGENEVRDRLGRFYSYYTETELRDFVTGAGFKIIESWTGEGVGLAGDISPWMLIHSQKLA